MEQTDLYKTIEKPTEEVLFKEKHSKFFGYCFPIQTEDDVKKHLEYIRKQHFSARHWCYAYQLGTEQYSYRANDDGEPSGSAGLPIYGQIQSFGLTNVLVIVVRYFGGIKLGVGGLVSAYKETAKIALEQAKIVEKIISRFFEIQSDYKDLSKVMRIIKERNLEIISQQMELDCRLTIAVPRSEAIHIYHYFEALYEITLREL